MTNDSEYKENSQAVQAHLGITQSVIQRMASNSASCKAWCITLVSAILVIVADKGNPQYVLFALIPNLLFLILDTYYLALEKMFRVSYNMFIDKLHNRELVASDLYAVSPSGSMFRTFFNALFSFSIWPFYLTLLAMVWIARVLVI
ncbi:hypothetical protein ES707_19594 [subsurface metagenome]